MPLNVISPGVTERMSRDHSETDEPIAVRIGPGLRLRLWLACLAGGLLAAAGLSWLVFNPDSGLDGDGMRTMLIGMIGLSVLVGVLVGVWLDHHIVGHLRGLLVALQSGQVADLRDLPADMGWGELTAVSDAIQERLRHGEREQQAQQQLVRTQSQLAALHAALMHVRLTGQWQRPAIDDPHVRPFVDLLAEAADQHGRADDNTREAAQRLAGELAAVIHEAHETAVHAERGFVEATSLQTSVRELQRLAQELHGALDVKATPEPETDPAAERAREALELLVEASSSSVESLGRGLLRVHDVSDQVQRIANRATLIAIEALSDSADSADSAELAAFAEELKHLARDVREATDRTTRYAAEIDDAVRAADASMRDARERALAHMAEPEPAAAPAAGPRMPDTERLMERVLEMVQDTGAKGERVSTMNEHASSIAERLARRLAGSGLEASDLVVRLTPTSALPLETPTATPGTALHLVDPVVEAPTSQDREERRP